MVTSCKRFNENCKNKKKEREIFIEMQNNRNRKAHYLKILKGKNFKKKKTNEMNLK